MDAAIVARMVQRVVKRRLSINKTKAGKGRQRTAAGAVGASLLFSVKEVSAADSEVSADSVAAVQRLVSCVRRSRLSLAQLFAKIDKDGSGSVDINEFRSGLRSVPTPYNACASLSLSLCACAYSLSVCLSLSLCLCLCPSIIWDVQAATFVPDAASRLPF